MNDYLELKNRHEKEFGEFPCFFAFSDKQFNEGMEKLGLEKTDTDKVYKGPGGMIYKKSNSGLLKDLMERHEKERNDAMKADTTGKGFLFEMFKYELANHEFGYTLDPEDTLDACGMSFKDVSKNGPIKTAFLEACQICVKETC